MSDTVYPFSAIAGLADLPCYLLQFGEARVVVSGYGAHVLSYQTEPGQELLWVSPRAVWQQQTPIRGGVPICWPWFGVAASAFQTTAAKLPNHGLARTALWQLSAKGQDATASWLRFSLELAALPHDAAAVTLHYDVRLSEQLELTLHCDSPVLQQAALHSYFQVPDSNQSVVEPLPLQWQDKVAAAERQSSQASLQFSGEIDRIYPATAALLTLSSRNDTNSNSLQLSIQQQGHDASVLWNPGAARSRNVPDLADDSYQHFVCVETAKLALTAAPLHLRQVIKAN